MTPETKVENPNETNAEAVEDNDRKHLEDKITFTCSSNLLPNYFPEDVPQQGKMYGFFCTRVITKKTEGESYTEIDFVLKEVGKLCKCAEKKKE